MPCAAVESGRRRPARGKDRRRRAVGAMISRCGRLEDGSNGAWLLPEERFPHPSSCIVSETLWNLQPAKASHIVETLKFLGSASRNRRENNQPLCPQGAPRPVHTGVDRAHVLDAGA